MRFLFATLAPAALVAQSASLSGWVRDSAESPVPNASLALTHVETGAERSARSNDTGFYALTSLAPGHYTITVEARGFQVKTVENVDLRADQNARLDFVLDGAAAEISGSVVDARGEALTDVLVRLADTAYRTTSGADGQFHLRAIPPGDYVLTVSTVGYHMEKQAFHIAAGQSQEFTVVLTPDTLRQTTTVAANADPFQGARGDGLDALTLAGIDAKNLGTVFVDDPLRSVQALPGVASDRDFDARFSLRGAGFDRIGLYMDGILLHDPFHIGKSGSGIGAVDDGTVAAFNGDMVESMELHKSAAPARFADSSAGVLDVETRDGSASSTLFRVGASTAAVSATAEGPLGRASGRNAKGSWIVAVRKSYLQYVLARTHAPYLFDMEDVETRLSYDFTPKNTVTLSLLESYSHQDQSNNASTLGINSILKGAYDYTLGNLAWRYSPDAKLLIVTHAAWMREKSNDTTPQSLPLSGGYYGEWVANITATWMWSEQAPLELGFQVRRIRNWDFSNQYQNPAGLVRILDHADGTAVQEGGYAQQSWSGWEGRMRLTAGARWDDHSIDRVAVVSPQASAAFGLTNTTRLALGWGEYAQYPDLSVFLSPFGNPGLLPMRSIQTVVALDQRLGLRTRLRVEAYDRADRDLPFQPTYDPRIVNGQLFNPPPNPLYYNSRRGHSRGAEIFLQRSSANRITGWISYAYGKTMMREGAVAGVSAQQFPSDYDQRQTINIYGGFRLRPTVNLSARMSYGSGFPIPGYFSLYQYQGYNYYFLASSRNQLRLPAYQRTDVRINKSWMHAKSKFTLYGEVINITDHGNYYYLGYNSYIPIQTAPVSISIDKTFPILPSAGMLLEW
jgi:hypothetical protein